MRKIITFEELAGIRRVEDGVIVHCHGVFDILHAGHIAYFESAKKHGQILVVTITSDRFVNKGPGRPHFTHAVRAHVVSHLSIVDYVCVSDYPTAVPAISQLRPHFYIKGPDYRDRTKDATGEIYNEELEVTRHGGAIGFTDDETLSSSSLANKFFLNWSDEQMRTINRIKELGGLALIHKYLNDIAKLKVLVLGEPIIDTYRFCNPQNLSSKSPSISAEFLYEENYAGGSLAIANHLVDFVAHLELLVPYGGEAFVLELLEKKIDQRIHDCLFEFDTPTPRKTRYIAVDKSQRMFELTELRNNLWDKNEPNELILEMLGLEKDLNIFADFGHGLFEGDLLGHCETMNEFIALNVQTNSSNFGFNPYKKHVKWDYLSLDIREAQVAFHDRNSSAMDLFRKIHTNERAVSLTLGKNGAYFHAKDKEAFSPAFSGEVIDATGAGDAYFGITALFTRVGAEPEVIPFVGNVFAGLKTKIIGNKQSVTRAQLIKACEAILK
jgi:cytidyltransferase-like protein